MNLNKKYIILTIGLGLVALGLLKPDLSKLINPIKQNQAVSEILVVYPDTDATKKACNKVVETIKNGPNPRTDGTNLASLYSDISRIIELKENETIIKNTEEISKVNSIAGALLQLNLKDKYGELSEQCDSVIKSVIGDENVPIDDETRVKAVKAFRNLAWACKEGSK
jgi:hypothetical protein